MQAIDMLHRASRSTARSLKVFIEDVGRGLLEVSHNTLALVGLAAIGVLVFTLGRADIRHEAEVLALEWLKTRHEEREQSAGNVLSAVAAPSAVARATAVPLADLPQPQATLATWIARRYKVAPEPVAALVQESFAIGRRAGLDPTLILAIIAVESSFNPFAQSPVGAQGLMQVMTRVHDDKYEAFGGTRAAFDPISNLRVGVQVLRDCIARAGSVQEGLRYYVGAALLKSDGGYASRVMAEQGHMRSVAEGQRVPLNVSNQPPVSAQDSTPAAAEAPPAPGPLALLN